MEPTVLIIVQGLEREQRDVARRLEREGCFVFTAPKAEHALDLLAKVNINLVLACQDRVPVDAVAEAAWRTNPGTHFLVVGGAPKSKTGWCDGYVQRPVTSSVLSGRALSLMSSLCGIDSRSPR